MMSKSCVQLMYLEHESNAHRGVGAAAQGRQGIRCRPCSERIEQGLVRVGHDTVRLVDLVVCGLVCMSCLILNYGVACAVGACCELDLCGRS